MSDLKSISDLTLSENEYCYTVKDKPYTSQTFEIRIPKFMPLMTGLANSCKLYFDRNIFLNDSDCMPMPDNYILNQNYLTINRAPTCTLFSKSNDDGIIYKNTRVKCTCLNGDIKNLVITDIV